MAISVPGQRRDSDDADALEMWPVIQRAQAGDQKATADLWCRYQPRVRRFLAARIHDASTVDDLSSDVWVRALRSLPNYTFQGSGFGAWLITIARNRWIDSFKGGYRRYETCVEFSSVDPLLDHVDDREHARPDELACDGIVHAKLRLLLAGLTADQRLCLQLRYMEGMSIAETAAAMGKDEGAVKALAYRAKDGLARLIGDGIDDRGAPVRYRALAKERVPS